MLKYVWSIISIILMVLVAPVVAQDDSEEAAVGDSDPCSIGSIFERVDGSYAEFQATRTSDDALSAFNDVRNFHEAIGRGIR